MPSGWPRCGCIPNHIPPHRANPFCSSEQRLAMVKLAAAENHHFVVDERELRRDKPSYTIDTLIELRHELPDTPLCFLMGMDSLLSLPSWHRWQELLDHAHLVVSVRPGWQPDYPAEVAQACLRAITPRMPTRCISVWPVISGWRTTSPSNCQPPDCGPCWMRDKTPATSCPSRLRTILINRGSTAPTAASPCRNPAPPDGKRE